MLNKLVLASGREVAVLGVLVEQTGVHMNAPEPWPHIAGRFQLAAAQLRLAAMRLGAVGAPIVLVDAWARRFEMPAVLEHPAKTVDRWRDFTPPDGRRLPPRWVCCAWLSSSPTRDDDGSHLVAAWGADAISDLDAEIVAAASTIAWEHEADGYSL